MILKGWKIGFDLWPAGSNFFQKSQSSVNGFLKVEILLWHIQRVDVNKRTVTTNYYSHAGNQFGHNMTSYSYFLSLELATSWPKLRFATIDRESFNPCRYVSLVNNTYSPLDTFKNTQKHFKQLTLNACKFSLKSSKCSNTQFSRVLWLQGCISTTYTQLRQV